MKERNNKNLEKEFNYVNKIKYKQKIIGQRKLYKKQMPMKVNQLLRIYIRMPFREKSSCRKEIKDMQI